MVIYITVECHIIKRVCVFLNRFSCSFFLFFLLLCQQNSQMTMLIIVYTLFRKFLTWSSFVVDYILLVLQDFWFNLLKLSQIAIKFKHNNSKCLTYLILCIVAKSRGKKWCGRRKKNGKIREVEEETLLLNQTTTTDWERKKTHLA